MERVKIDDFAKIWSLSELCVSPDGKRIAFVRSKPDIEKNVYQTTIWIGEGEKVRQLTHDGREAGIVWLDEETLLFPGKKKEGTVLEPGQAETVYNQVSVRDGKVKEAFTVPMKCKKIYPICEDEFLVTAVYDHNVPDFSALTGEEKKEAVARWEEEKDYEVFDELPFWSNGTGVINKKRTRLYLFQKNSEELILISPRWMNVAGFDYDKKTDRVLYFGSDYQWMDEKKSDLYVCRLHESGTDGVSSSVKINLERKFAVDLALWAGDRMFFSASDYARFGAAENPCQFMANPDDGTFRMIGDLDCSMSSTVGSDVRRSGGKNAKVIDGDWYFSSTRGFRTEVVRLTAAGEEETVSPKGFASIDGWDYADGVFYCVAMEPDGLQELYCWDRGSKKITKLTDFNGEYKATHEISRVTPLCFVNKDGVEIDGWVMKPVGFDPGNSYPAILNVHGGPKTVYGEVFYHEMQFLASEGYFVFFCNPRGGDGKGNVFADISGDQYGVKDYEDLMEFTDRVLEAYPQIDKKRMGMTGGSYGGYMANWIVGHTNRFAAVASQRSISNFISKCLTSDIGYYYNMSAMKCDPWSDAEAMWHRSPLKYADKCVTPTLFIQSDEDYRCWMTDAIQMFTALRMHGCPTRLCLFHGENHELSRSGKPKHRVRRLREITDWFDQYLR